MTGAAGADGPGDTECEGGEVDVTMFFEPFAPLFEFSRQMDRLLPASAAARPRTASSIFSVSFPVKVFCCEGW